MKSILKPLALTLLLSLSAAAQLQRRGTWSAEANTKHPEKLQLNLYRSARMQTGNSIPIADLRGLDPQSIHAANTNVTFQLVRDAGSGSLPAPSTAISDMASSTSPPILNTLLP